MNDPINKIDPSGEFLSATLIVSQMMRRPYLTNQGKTYEALNQAGQVNALEAMATLTDITAYWYRGAGANRGQFVEDLLWMFTDRGPGMESVRGNLDLDFDDTGFNSRYRDGGNQVRHFIGCMGAGYYFGMGLGRAAVIENERRGRWGDDTWPDIRLGFEGVNLGTALRKEVWGTYFMDVLNVGDWMRDRLGE
jgi:hypothetical protein